MTWAACTAWGRFATSPASPRFTSAGRDACMRSRAFCERAGVCGISTPFDTASRCCRRPSTSGCRTTRNGSPGCRRPSSLPATSRRARSRAGVPRPARLERPCCSRRMRWREWSTAAARRAAATLSLHDSRRDSACARETFIRRGTRDCRVTCERRAASSFSTAVCFSFPTRTRISAEKNRSIFTRCDSPRANCGANRRRAAIPSTWTCGTTISSRSDPVTLLRDEGGPVFAEPWQAQAFALTVKLSEQGHFTWKEWASALALELHDAAGRGEPDDGSRYYEHWLAALERLVTAKGLAEP